MNLKELDEVAKKRAVYTVEGMECIPVKGNIPYKTVGNSSLRMNVYYPLDMKEGMIRPAVLFVHGGGPPERVEYGKDIQSLKLTFYFR